MGGVATLTALPFGLGALALLVAAASIPRLPRYPARPSTAQLAETAFEPKTTVSAPVSRGEASQLFMTPLSTMTSSRQTHPRTPARPAPGSGFLFVLATLACVAGLVATYYYFVQTTTGQFIDESALVEAVDIHGPAGKAATRFLDLLPTISLVMAAVVILFVTVIRQHWTEAGIAVAACIGANVATQVLKDLLPARPDKGVVTLELNSLPSGHTTLAASAAAAVFLMASPRGGPWPALWAAPSPSPPGCPR